MAGRYKTVVNQLEVILDEFLEGDDIEDIPGIVDFILNDVGMYHDKIRRINEILNEDDDA